jgi:hypothetical protein
MRIIGGLFAFAGLPAGAVPFPSRFDLFIFAKRIVRVAVQPTLTELSRGDDRMSACERVLAGVTIWGAVTAERDAARLAGAQMDPV